MRVRDGSWEGGEGREEGERGLGMEVGREEGEKGLGMEVGRRRTEGGRERGMEVWREGGWEE